MVRLKAEEEERFNTLSEGIISHPDYQSMKKLIAHGRNTVYDHSIDVARLAFKLSSRLHLLCDEKELINDVLVTLGIEELRDLHGDESEGMATERVCRV